MSTDGARRVKVWEEQAVIPTYAPMPADRNPMFLEKRVYQGSSGKVYPLPFIDRIDTQKRDRHWRAVYLENEYLRVMLLPEIGGRIHAILDKTNGYDVIYRQDVIKPALVGLAGPWISGGIEFNWPQHHRPGTFMPADVKIEEHPDGAVTVWMSEHDPMSRMKGMHGVCVRPGCSYVELKVRLHNRTQATQTFLWWANVATRVHELYQSFFPRDVGYVADHAKRAVSRYPLCDDKYYGVDYGARGRSGVPEGERPERFVPPAGRYAANDLSWYANIPVPTSYMCVGSNYDFFGGYDHGRRAGLIHVANHHVSPGKKQWTWGNHAFGYAWDRNLSDDEGPYIELMAGVYTDNQPDFSFLAPGETKTFSQYWYPIREIGPADYANLNGAISIRNNGGEVWVGVATSSAREDVEVRVTGPGGIEWRRRATIAPDRPLVERIAGANSADGLSVEVRDRGGEILMTYGPAGDVGTAAEPEPATEPPAPPDVASNDELYVIGLHLWQYRHATRTPESYWEEALRRDPADSRCNVALGNWRLGRGEFELAATHYRAAIARLTSRNPNPYDGEAYYGLGQALRYLGEDGGAYDAFYKATWNNAWQSAAYLCLAELDCRKGLWVTAEDHLRRCLRVNTDHLWARDLLAIILRKVGRDDEAQSLLAETLRVDPLDHLAAWLAHQRLDCDAQTVLDLVLDLNRAGLTKDALEMLDRARPETALGVAPLIPYYKAFVSRQPPEAPAHPAALDYCFPHRLDEILILQSAIAHNRQDGRAAYLLGNLFYDRRRYRDAIRLWKRAARALPGYSVVWRNLGIAYFNVSHDPAKAKAAYERAVRGDPADARLWYERDQLWKRLNVNPKRRLGQLLRHRDLVDQRDDLSVELCALLNRMGRHAEALKIVGSRQFQPWEGGEGQALTQYVTAHRALGTAALRAGDAAGAVQHFRQALDVPTNLGEARHLLSNSSDVHFLLAEALAAAGDPDAARRHYTVAAEFVGDFQSMSVCPYSEMTYCSAMALRRLGKAAQATNVLRGLKAYAERLETTPAKIDYFATSLPTMLLFDDDLSRRQATTAAFLRAQAELGLGRIAAARSLLKRVLRRDPNHALAAEFLADLTDRASTRKAQRQRPRTRPARQKRSAKAARQRVRQ